MTGSEVFAHGWGNIREEAAKLDEFYSRIASCRVIIEIPHQHQHRGYWFHTHIDLTVPGGEIIVNHEHALCGRVRISFFNAKELAMPKRTFTTIDGNEAVAIPIIGSLNGVSIGGWTGYANLIQEAGADGLVLFNRFYSFKPAVAEKSVLH